MTKIIHRMAEERRQEDGLAVAIRFDRVQCWSAHWSCPWKNMVLEKNHLTRTLLANWYWKKIEGKTNSNHPFIRTLLTCGVCGLSLAPPSVIYRLGFCAHKLFVTTSITSCMLFGIFIVTHTSPREDSTSKVVYCQFLFRNPYWPKTTKTDFRGPKMASKDAI